MPLLPALTGPRLCRVAASALALAFVGLGLPAAAARPAITEVGWWSRQPGASAPAGGFSVAEAPDDDVSVAALRVSVDAREPALAAVLTLPENGGQAQNLAGLRACVTADPWSGAVAPGPYDQRPKPDCSMPVTLERNPDSSTWSGDIANLLANRSGEVSIMIVPGQPSGGSGTLVAAPAFTIVFDPPTLESTTLPPPAPTSPPTTTSTTTRATTASSPPPPPPPPPAGVPQTPPPAPPPPAPAPPPTTIARPVPAPVSTTRAAAGPATTVASAPGRPPAPPSTAAAAPPSTAAPVPGQPASLPAQLRRRNPDRVRGAGVIPYVVFAVVISVAAALAKFATDKGLWRSLVPRSGKLGPGPAAD